MFAMLGSTEVDGKKIDNLVKEGVIKREINGNRERTKKEVLNS